MRPQREARGHRAVCRIHQIRGNLHGHILRAGVQSSPAASKGTSLSGLLSDNTANRIPQVVGELRGVRNLVVGIVMGCADAGEGTSTEHPEARQTVEEILIRAGNRSLAVAERGTQNRHLLLRGGTTATQTRKSSTQVHIARRAVRNLTALHHGVRRG